MKILLNKNQYGYSASASNKQDELKCYISVNFKKGEEPQADCCQIKVIDGFLSCYKKNNGEIAPKIVVMEFEIIKTYEKTTPTEQAKPFERTSPKMFEVKDDGDLPF